MLVSAYITFASVLVATRNVFAQNGIAIKKTQYPYMAFIFYSDESLVDETGARFRHGAVLIKPDLLLSASVDKLRPNGTGFPQKTLLARMGATSLDPKFTLNEDEEEQEREVVKVTRPRIHEPSLTQYWRTDITLLKTLLPFNTTPAVAPVSLNFKRTYAKSCTILVLMPGQEDKTLTSFSVEMLPKCGRGIDENTMACAMDGEETKLAMINPEFCIGNSGGPLICEGEVMALQTYIDSNCSLPRFQRISGWETFITCGSEDKCNDIQCSGICAVTYKDTQINNAPESSVRVPAISSSTETMTISISSVTETMTIDTTDHAKQDISSAAVSEIIQYENIPTVPAAVDKKPANIRKSFDEKVNIEFIPVGETSTDSTTPKAIKKTVMTELVTSSSKPTLVFETTANLEVHTTESKKEGPPLHMTSVDVSAKSSTFEPKTDARKAIMEAQPKTEARKAIMEAQLEGKQGRELQPVLNDDVYQQSGTSSTWQNLCYKVAIVLTLLVIAM